MDNEKIEYSKEYTFNKTGRHDVKFELYESISMDYMFQGIEELTSVIMFSIQYPQIKSMISTFESCINLKQFTVSGFDFSEIKSLHKIFYGTSVSLLNINWFF